MRRKVDDLFQAKSEPKSLRFFFRYHLRNLWILINPRMCAVCKEKRVIMVPSGLAVRHKVWVSKERGVERVQMSWEIIIKQRDMVGIGRMLLVFVQSILLTGNYYSMLDSRLQTRVLFSPHTCTWNKWILGLTVELGSHSTILGKKRETQILRWSTTLPPSEVLKIHI